MREGYELHSELDATGATRKWLLVSFAGLIFIVSLGLSGWFSILVRQEFESVTAVVFPTDLPASVLISVIIVANLLKLIKAIMYASLVGSRLTLRFKCLFLRIEEPQRLLTRRRALWIYLAPVSLVTLAGISLILSLPSYVVPTVTWGLAMSTAISVFDVIAVPWLMSRPHGVLVAATGDRIQAFTISAESGGSS